MDNQELNYYLSNPVVLETAMEDVCENIRLYAQSMAKEELEIAHLTILRKLSLSYNRLTYTKMLTISADKIKLFKDAELLEEIAESTINDFIQFIYSKSNKSSNILQYLKYFSGDAFAITDEREQKLFELITTRFNGKKIDKRKIEHPEEQK